ncbi:transposase [Ammoniphilus sp. 3BR4]|uniref:transposase n=1 Tax=Ammoniphilus sp. 3BR4 TaxID=3158265 RepID=UPI003465A4E3
MIKTILTHIDFLTEQIEMLDQEVTQRVSSYQEDVERLDSIPGISTRMEEQILAEVGTNVKDQFPSAPHMCSWAGLFSEDQHPQFPKSLPLVSSSYLVISFLLPAFLTQNYMS